MLSKVTFQSAVLATCISLIIASPSPQAEVSPVESEAIVIPVATRQPVPVVQTVPAKIDNVAVNSNTSIITSNVTTPAAVVAATTVKSTVLIFARDTASSYSGYSGLNGYAIPYQVVVVPQAGVTLPALNSSATSGNYGAIVILSEVSYDYGGTTGFQSALTSAQLATLYQYQVTFGVRMVRLDVFPSADSGTTALGDCCGAGVEQLLSISDTTKFATSGLKTSGAGVSTQGLYHYPATITNSSIATEFIQFAPAAGFSTTSTAGVINNIGGQQQV
ncbi:hypothetical protein LARI1_G006113 [Lachnellula arida]|uniref:Agd3 CBM87 domain-containing protein n=1 Tax=Lachnellula arida TaxID=1316785 RepID=A0A8T9B5Y8_9HELO|nr:hypothetical protein LARI1_G006113 [Lachnellula arida]